MPIEVRLMWRTVAERAVGIVYLVGAMFNTVYTLRNANSFYGDFPGSFVGPALVAGGVFALTAALFSSPGCIAGNLVLAAIQIGLAASR